MSAISLWFLRLIVSVSLAGAAASCQNSQEQNASTELPDKQKPATETDPPQLSIDQENDSVDEPPTVNAAGGVNDHCGAPLPKGALLRLETTKLKPIYPWFGSIQFSPDGKILALVDIMERTIFLWDVGTGKEHRKIEGFARSLQRVVFSPDGKTLAYQSNDHTIQLWEIASGKQLVKNEWDYSFQNSMPFSPNGKILASGSEIGVIHLWDTATGNELRTLEGPALKGADNIVKSIAFSPDGGLLATIDDQDRTIRLWEVENGNERRNLNGGGDSIAFSPEGSIITSWRGMLGDAIRLWEVATGREMQTLDSVLPHYFSGTRTVIVSPNGKILMSVQESFTVKGSLRYCWVNLWDVFSGKKLKEIEGEPYTNMSVAFSPDNKAFALETQRGGQTIRLWDVMAGKVIKQIEVNHQSHPENISFSPDHKTLATSNKDYAIQLWDVATGKVLKQFEGHKGFVSSFAFSPDGKTLATASADATILLWKVD